MCRLFLSPYGFSEWRRQISTALSYCVSVMNSLVWNSCNLSKLFKGHCSSLVLHKKRCPTVAHLIFLCRPSAVGRLIVSIIVNSFNGHAFRAFAHVFKKIFKGLPSFAYFYPSCSIKGKSHSFGVLASLSHAAPNVMNCCFAFSVSRPSAGKKHFLLQAAARFCSSSFQVCRINFNNFSAVAHKSPNSSAATAASCFIQCNKTTKSKASEIDEFHLSNSIRIICMEAQR